MTPAELHRLRALLRENDPATGVDGPTREQSERLRRIVLATVPVPAAGAFRLGRRRGFDAPRWAVAAAVIALLAAGGAMLVRVAGGARAEVEAVRRPVLVPVPSAPATVEPRATTGAVAPSSITTPEPQVAALAARDSGRQPSTAAPPPLAAAAPAAEVPGPAAPPAATPGDADAPTEAAALTEAETPSEANTPSEALAIAALPAPLGRQIQVTAPGGTRIVWILTPSTGP